MRKIVSSNKFRKDLKTILKRGYNSNLLKEIINQLVVGKILDNRYKDHPLSGDYINYRECHIAPDWLLIYKISNNNLELYLYRTGHTMIYLIKILTPSQKQL